MRKVLLPPYTPLITLIQHFPDDAAPMLLYYYKYTEKALKSGVHILVATPGRALDHISRGTVDLSNVQHVVLDEGMYTRVCLYSLSYYCFMTYNNVCIRCMYTRVTMLIVLLLYDIY